MNANKTEDTYFRLGAIFTLNSKPLKLVGKFTYLSGNISSTECDVKILLTKTWNAIEKLLIIWKSNLSYKLKRDFQQAVIVSILLCACSTLTQETKTKTKIKQKTNHPPLRTTEECIVLF